MENLTPCKIGNLKQIDYVDERNVRSKFRENRSPGPSGQLSCDYLFLLSEQRREQFSGRILTLNGSKNAESLKNVPFGIKNEKLQSDPYLPPKLF